MSLKTQKIIAITMGDPQGIGPEIILKSLERYSPTHPTVIIGSEDFLPQENMTPIANIEEVKKRGIYFYNIPPTRNSLDYPIQWRSRFFDP